MITLLVSLIRVLWAFVGGILKIVVYLLRVFGLILPLCYLAVCLILNAATDNAVFSNGTYRGLFYAGLVLSLVGAVLLFFRNTVKAPLKNHSLNKRERDLRKWEEELAAREADLEAREARAGQEAPPPPEPAAPPYAGVQPGFQAAVSQSAFQPQGMPQGQGFSQPPPSGMPQPQPTPSGNGFAEGLHAVSPQPIPPDWEDPKPKIRPEPEIYRVRQNPEYLLYDYGSYIDIYRETRRGLRFVRRDRKEEDGHPV